MARPENIQIMTGKREAIEEAFRTREVAISDGIVESLVVAAGDNYHLTLQTLPPNWNINLRNYLLSKQDTLSLNARAAVRQQSQAYLSRLPMH